MHENNTRPLLSATVSPTIYYFRLRVYSRHIIHWKKLYGRIGNSVLIIYLNKESYNSTSSKTIGDTSSSGSSGIVVVVVVQ